MGLFSNFFKPSYHDLCEKGIKAFDENDLEAAINFFAEAIKADGSQPRAYYWSGLVFNDIRGRYFIENNKMQGHNYAELAIIAFDKAIEFETDANAKAYDYWQKAIALESLNRTTEHDTAIAAANHTVPGFSAKMEQENTKMLTDAFKSLADKNRHNS